MNRFARAMAAVGTAALTGCSSTGDPRPQLLVVIDTDLPTRGQVFLDPTLSGDAAIDTIRIDALNADGTTAFDVRTFAAPDVADWPLSLGIPTEDFGAGQPIRLRIRIFQAANATAGDSNGTATVDPLPGVSVDRLVEARLPAEGIEALRITLRGDCFGAPIRFTGDAPTTCIDASMREGAPTAGLVPEDPEATAPSLAGTWPLARERPCTGQGPAETVCIPGGFSILGDTRLAGIDEAGSADTAPLRPVVLSPFWMDRTELTVGEVVDLVEAGYAGLLPTERDPAALGNARFCTFAPEDSQSRLPVNCLPLSGASDLCAFRGGQLPSEAQWSHTARGRGQHRLFPWGDRVPDCCIASASRQGPEGIPVECAGEGLEPVGSHPADPACPGGFGDVSRDGVLDLGGSLSEPLRDDLDSFGGACWAGSILVDPTCDSSGLNQAGRGGYWNAGLARTATPFRGVAAPGPDVGVRCVYEDAP